MLLGAYGTVVSDAGRGYGKVDVIFHGHPRPRLMDASRLVVTEESTPTREDEMKALLANLPQPVKPVSILSPLNSGPTPQPTKPYTVAPKTQWQIDNENREREQAKVTREAREKQVATYKQAKVKAKEVLARLKEAYPTQADLDREEAFIHMNYEVWKRKNKERLQHAYWSK